MPLALEPTFLRGQDGLFEATIRLNTVVHEEIRFGQMPIVEARGFQSELEDVTHLAGGFTTAPWNFEVIAREWQLIESIDQLSVKPVMRLGVVSVCPRYRPLVAS